ncbi:hypothetical protein ACTXT7_000866 [Hymenolepis weldensis]
MSKKGVNSYKPNIQNYSYTLKDGSHVNPSYKDLVLPNILKNGSKCVHDLFKEAMTLGGDRDFLGTHPTPTSPYVWKSFREVYELVRQFGSGLRTIDSLMSEPFKCCGIYGKNRPEWLIAQYACFSYRLTIVPLFDTLGDEALLYICKQTELSVVVCDTAKKAIHLLSLAEKIPYVKHVIIMNNGDDLTVLKAKAGDSIKIVTFNDILERGKASPVETMIQFDYTISTNLFIPSEPDDLALVCYTSGTTGVPKGVIISNRMMLASLNNNMLNSGQDLLTIFNRGRIGFYSGEPRLLFEDAKMLKPTLWTTVPRILLRIYEGVQKKIANSTFKKALLNRAVGAKIKNVDAQPQLYRPHYLLLTIDRVPVFEGYGSTETAGSLSSAAASDRDGGHVGAPVPGLKVKLADIPSMGIVAARDNKGEIRVKGPSCTTGYYKDSKNTLELFDSEGWMRTGDVAIWTEKNSLKIVDRCKHIFKLSQGEYVAPEKIESVYLESRFVTQVFVDGDTEQSYPVAIVVPEAQTLVQYINYSKPDTATSNNNGINKRNQQQKEAAAGDSATSAQASGEQSKDKSAAVAVAARDKKSAVQTVDPNQTYVVHGSQMTLEQLCDYKPAIKTVLEDLNALGKARGLKGFEQVKAIRLSAIPFTTENGMLTPTLKSARDIIRREFASAIKALYHPTSI